MTDAHVLVPLKRLDVAKGRLAAVLEPHERSSLMRDLLHHVVGTVREAGVTSITLVTGEAIELEGIDVWHDRGLPWNDALAQATLEVVVAPVVAVVSADLPFLQAADVYALLEATPRRGIAIARAEDAGTNAISMRPPGALHTVFGERDSARLHAAAAHAAGLEAVIVDRPGLAFDLDTPEHLARVRG